MPELGAGLWAGAEAPGQHPAWSCVCFPKPASTNPGHHVKFKAALERPLWPACSVFVILTHPHPCFSRPRACAHLQGWANTTGDQDTGLLGGLSHTPPQRAPSPHPLGAYLWAGQALDKPAYLQTYTPACMKHLQRTLS